MNPWAVDLPEQIARNFEATSEIVPRPIPILPTPLEKRESLRFPPTVYPPSPTTTTAPARLARVRPRYVSPARTILFTLRYNLLAGAWQCREDCTPPYCCVFGKPPVAQATLWDNPDNPTQWDAGRTVWPL